jgi:hypothetical protein
MDTTTVVPADALDELERAAAADPRDAGPLDAAGILVDLHARVERLFAAYDAAEGSNARRYRAVAAIGAALATHVALEDELLYPALRDETARHDGEIERQLQQDHVLDLLLVELGAMVPSDRGYDAKVRVLMQAFRQHARDAEALLLPELRRRLDADDRRRLGRRLLDRTRQLEQRPRPGW